jgi:cation transport regulator ChaB
MSDVVQLYYEKLFDLMFTGTGKIQVASDFHGQMGQINSLLRNDTTALINTILEFMVHSANVPYSFDAQNESYTKIINQWANNLNEGVNLDIPKGLRNFTEQFMRERLRSSLLVIRIKWGTVNGFTLPTRMWLMDGSSIYVKNDSGFLNTNQYYVSKSELESSPVNKIRNTKDETIIIRKPYNQWYEKYPTPYLVKKGTLYHAMFKEKILERIAEVVNTAFPYQFFIKMGTEQAINMGKGPSDTDLEKQLSNFQKLKADFDTHQFAKGLGGAFPGDVKFEEIIPSYEKVLNDKILTPVDKNILSSLGMVELQGFSQDRKEMILNPKVLVEEVVDCVNDYTDFLKEVMDLIKQKNANKYTVSESIEVSPGIIESFVTDEMRTLMRSLYDRGLVSMEDILEDTTPLKFKTQIKKRDFEVKNKLDVKMYPRVVQNMENSPADLTPNNEDISLDKQPGSPESKNYKNAISEEDLITEPMKSIRSIPEEFRSLLSIEQQRVFKTAFNQALADGKTLGYDKRMLEKTSIEYAVKQALEYIETSDKK